jgi:peptide/nickel transport system ATP-binding protein
MAGSDAGSRAPVGHDRTAASAAGAEPVLEVERLKAYYQTHYFGVDREVRAVDGVDLCIAADEIYGLAGESSSGKTTLMRVIAAATKPPLNVVDGSVRFDFGDARVDMLEAPAADIAAIRWRHLAYIMQGSLSALNPLRRIKATFFDFAFAHIGASKREFSEIVADHLERLHLEPSVLEAYPHELSGGMRQRVTVALATVCRPSFIIADEPTTALDVVVQKRVLGLIQEIQQELGSSMVFVTHDMAVHANLSNRIGIMYAGRLVEEGPTREVFSEPLHPYTRHLIGSLPQLGDSAPRQGLDGSPPNLADPPAGCRFHPRCAYAMDRCRAEAPSAVAVGGRRRVACFAVCPEAPPC